MKLLAPDNMGRWFVRMTTLGVTIWILMAASGCVALSFLLNPGPFESKTKPAYNLLKEQDRMILIWVECPLSARADHDLSEKLTIAFRVYMTENAGFKGDNLILNPVADQSNVMLDPKQVARSQGAGYVLLVHVDDYAADFLQIRDYFAGELITRSILLDADLGIQVWPSQPEGKMVHISVEMESGGRSALLSRLVAAAAHCTLRDLYPCDKLKYKHGDERISTQEAFELETY